MTTHPSKTKRRDELKPDDGARRRLSKITRRASRTKQHILPKYMYEGVHTIDAPTGSKRDVRQRQSSSNRLWTCHAGRCYASDGWIRKGGSHEGHKLEQRMLATRTRDALRDRSARLAPMPVRSSCTVRGTVIH